MCRPESMDKRLKLICLLLIMCLTTQCSNGHQQSSFHGDSMACSTSPQERIDCYPEIVPDIEKVCASRGCCYSPSELKKDSVPWCFYPRNYTRYELSKVHKTKYGLHATLNLIKNGVKRFENEIDSLALDVYMETPHRLRFKISDPKKSRFQVPISLPSVATATKDSLLQYSVSITTSAHKSFGIIVKRKPTGTTLFNTTIGPLIYAEQFLQISSSLPSTKVYGLGERHSGSLVDTDWNRLVFWARDQAPRQHTNLYGDHPFYVCIEDDGLSHGVFFLNSNAKEIDLQPAPAVTWRTIGGVLDFYVFVGPKPEDVVAQYTSVVGRPLLPPYWSLGFHLCRWGYGGDKGTLSIVNKMRSAMIPQDVQWNDIDYMRKHLDFTYDDKVKFHDLPAMVNNLHEHGQHYVMIIDPGISNEQAPGSYAPYSDGLESDVFVKNPAPDNRPIEGQVWPGRTVYPDFFHPNSSEYWRKNLQAYHDAVKFDGVWIDMNEPSNFVAGSTSGCPVNSLENPPYMPKVEGGALNAMTLCASARHHRFTHYDVHNMYGLSEMRATSFALSKIRPGKRTFVISRSTFPSAGRYGGHWTGDISSTWVDLRQSIAGIINFNLFGIPLVGADICGFGKDTTEELCTRWMQLGAFYPFSRNHNSIDQKGQAPVEFSAAAQSNMRQALLARYTFLPYLYSLFYAAYTDGATVARGLYFEFPYDLQARQIENQFMWGPGLLISPALYQNTSKVKAYFPPAIWYNLYDQFGAATISKGSWQVLPASLHQIPLHLRGGVILPAQLPAINTVKSRQNPFMLYVAPGVDGTSSGFLFWDDGESLLAPGTHLLVEFKLQNRLLSGHVKRKPSGDLNIAKLQEIYLMGMKLMPTLVQVNGEDVDFVTRKWNIVQINAANIDLTQDFVVTWDS